MFRKLQDLDVPAEKLEAIMYREEAVALLQKSMPRVKTGLYRIQSGDYDSGLSLRQSGDTELRKIIEKKAKEKSDGPAKADSPDKSMPDKAVTRSDKAKEPKPAPAPALAPAPKQMKKAGGNRQAGRSRQASVSFAPSENKSAARRQAAAGRGGASAGRRGSINFGVSLAKRSGVALHPTVEALWADQAVRGNWINKFADCGLYTVSQLRNAMKASSGVSISLLRLPKEALYKGKAKVLNELVIQRTWQQEWVNEEDMTRMLELVDGDPTAIPGRQTELQPAAVYRQMAAPLLCALIVHERLELRQKLQRMGIYSVDDFLRSVAGLRRQGWSRGFQTPWRPRPTPLGNSYSKFL
jgi:hypothetical protein